MSVETVVVTDTVSSQPEPESWSSTFRMFGAGPMQGVGVVTVSVSVRWQAHGHQVVTVASVNIIQ